MQIFTNPLHGKPELEEYPGLYRGAVLSASMKKLVVGIFRTFAGAGIIYTSRNLTYISVVVRFESSGPHIDSDTCPILNIMERHAAEATPIL